MTVAVVVFVHLPSVNVNVTVCTPVGEVARFIAPVTGLMTSVGEVYVPVSSPVLVTGAVPVAQNGDPGYVIVATGRG